MKTKISIICSFTAVLMQINTHSFCQTKEIKESTGPLVYLYTDRSDYLPGESILFKTYLPYDSSNPNKSPGNTLFVGLIDQDGQEVASGKFPVQNYQATGKLDLSKFLTEGKYVLIACTNLMKSASPQSLFSKMIEVTRSEEPEFFTDIKLKDTLYTSASNLTAIVEFSGNGNNPVSATFSYQLIGTGGIINSGKNKANEDGKAFLTMLLTTFDKEEILKLLVTATYKRYKNTTGIVIPTPYNRTNRNNNPEKMSQQDKFNGMNIRIETIKPQYKTGEKVTADIYVTDNKGNPVSANLSVSASNPLPGSSFHLKNDSLTSYYSWRQAISYMKDPPIQTLDVDQTAETGSGPVFNSNIRKIFAQCLSLLTETPGISYLVQEKNDLKKIKSEKEHKPLMKQYGYSNDLTIFQVLMQIKPYQLVAGKIIFATTGINSINNQDGALIVIDGIKIGTDATVLNTIPVPDIAKINILTNPSDIQRYTGLNSVGVIEIITKKGGNNASNEEPPKTEISRTIFWNPDIKTDSSGKTTASFFNNNKSSEVIISVEGITPGGLIGKSTVHYSVK
jgi:hypothetical protein